MESSMYENELLAGIAAAIHTHGHMTYAVGTGECSVPGCRCAPDPRPWAYTVGLCQSGHPELLTFGLGSRSAHSLIEWVASQYRSGAAPPVGRDHELEFDETPIRLVAVPQQCIEPSRDLMACWYAYYSSFGRVTIPDVVQVVHADLNARFPWHADYDRSSRFGQPVLEDDPNALRRQISPTWPTRRTNAGSRRRR